MQAVLKRAQKDCVVVINTLQTGNSCSNDLLLVLPYQNVVKEYVKTNNFVYMNNTKLESLWLE